MLKEYLRERPSEKAVWRGGMPGVEVCRFALSGPSPGEIRAIPLRGQPLHFETFFCLGGCLLAETAGAGTSLVRAEGVFFLSDVSRLRSFRVSGDLRGILIAVDAKAARESLFSICAALGLTLDTGVVRRKMEARQGCAVLGDVPWRRALFEDLGRLGEKEGERYCVFKAVELLYLLCAGGASETRESGGDGYYSHTIFQVRAYLEDHLEEKQTIETLSRAFSLSATSLKTGFRRMYGQSLHHWLVGQRMRRACELMRTSDLSLLDIAQAVGYDSVSQFSAVFKREWGMPPGQYKKMSDAGDPRLF